MARTTRNGRREAVYVSRGQEISSRVLTVPNAISMLRLALVPVFAVLIVAHEDVWARVVLAISGVTDWLEILHDQQFVSGIPAGLPESFEVERD
jgi:hypothetical protein